MKFFKNDPVPKVLFIAYVALFIAAGIHPYDREVWVAENLPIFGIAVALTVLYWKKIRFSPASYIFMSVLLFLHTIGGHFTFERVPFDWFTNLFGFERNHYDRIAHFSVGFYAYPIAEFIFHEKLVKGKWMLFLFPVFAIFFVAAGYEILEWWFAVSSDPSAGGAFLGSQGDIWDAQKDMFADGLGAIVSSLIFLWSSRKKK